MSNEHCETEATFSFEQLSDQAKEKVRDKFREHHLDYDWWGQVFEDFINTAAYLNFNVSSENVIFSGFWRQGDGASFSGRYTGHSSCTSAIQEHRPNDQDLADIAGRLDVLCVSAKLQGGNGWSARIYRNQGHSVHSAGMYVDDVEDDTRVNARTDHHDAEDVILQAARDLADWLYETLQAEYEYLTADEQIDPLIADLAHRYDELGSII